MRYIRPWCLFLLVAGCAHVRPGPDDVRATILDLERQRQQAQLHGDWQSIQKLNSPDLLDITGNGGIRTAAENTEAMRSGKLKFTVVDMTDQQVRVYGNVAVVTGIGHRTGSNEGVSFDQRFRFSRIYVLQDGGWRAVVAQNTRIEPTSH